MRRELSREEGRLLREKRKPKPSFLRQEFHKLKRLKKKWRKPRGIDSKQKVGERGEGKRPKIGYKKSEAARKLHPSGFYPRLVRNPKELRGLDTEKEAAIIASSVGRRKREEILKVAKELKIVVLNEPQISA